MPLPETSMHQRGTQSLDKCSICENLIGPFILEDRPTGKDLILQRWAYCEACWDSSQITAMDSDLAAQRYLVFSRWVMSAYRLERRRTGVRHAYRIVPMYRCRYGEF